MNIQLCWFRTDLRTHDNTALLNALQSGPTVAIYIATPEQWKNHNDAPIKIDFWRRNLLELEKDLTTINVPLLVFEVNTYSDTPQIFDYLICHLNLDGIHFNKEYPLNEFHRDQNVTKVFIEHGLNVSTYDDQVLLAPGTILNKQGDPFKVFTPFSKSCKKILYSMPPLSEYCPKNKQTSPKIKTLQHPSLKQSINKIDWPERKNQWQLNWPAGEQHASKLLSKYCLEQISNYNVNRDQPALDGTSKISPYLNSGVISIRECWRSAQTYHQNTGVGFWLNELLWRDFYKHIVYHFPHVCRNKPWKSKYDNFKWKKNSETFSC